MTPDEIRNLVTVSARPWDSLEGTSEQLCIASKMLQEIAAQLAEANEMKRKEADWMRIRANMLKALKLSQELLVRAANVPPCGADEWSQIADAIEQGEKQ